MNFLPFINQELFHCELEVDFELRQIFKRIVFVKRKSGVVEHGDEYIFV